MSKPPTKVIFLWHMHQPCYKHPQYNYYILPWVRLHGVKDYYGMAKTVEKCEGAKAVFNFSGVLLNQIIDYAQNNAQDYYLILSLKNPSYLDETEKNFITDRFFSVNQERFIRPNPRYQQLYNKKLSPKAKFSVQDIKDLVVLFNLCWFHPYTVKDDSCLRGIIKKGKDYNSADRDYVFNKQREIIGKIIPLYQKLLRDKKIELALTPYHHPIMPLINDTDVLKDFSYLKKPACRFQARQDCVWHLNKAKEVFKTAFNCDIKGSWPSEGSVCEEVISIYRNEGFDWVAADEDILFKSLTTEYVSFDMIKKQRQLIYRTYKFRDVNIFFRDRNLSDAIGFIYHGWDNASFAAQDLLEHFKRTHNYIKNISKERVITIIMDGENAWEYYKNNGVDFLEAVYRGIEQSPVLCASTASQFLETNRSRKLERLASGSWINGDFGVWVGNKKNNSYWQILRTMKDLINAAKQTSNLDKAKDYFYLLEGSDWYWWNTFEDSSGEFKNIFFYYIEEIYKLLGKKAPSYIFNDCRGGPCGRPLITK